MSKEHKFLKERMANVDKVMRRDGYNRGINAAVKRLIECGLPETAKWIKKLRKPQLDLPILRVKR